MGTPCQVSRSISDHNGYHALSFVRADIGVFIWTPNQLSNESCSSDRPLLTFSFGFCSIYFRHWETKVHHAHLVEQRKAEYEQARNLEGDDDVHLMLAEAAQNGCVCWMHCIDAVGCVFTNRLLMCNALPS